MRLLYVCMLFLLFFPQQLVGQKKGSPSASGNAKTPGPSAPSPDSTSGGSIENAMIAYDAMSVIAKQITTKTKAAILKDGSNKQNVCDSKNILLLDPDGVSQIGSYRTFKAVVEALKAGYEYAQTGIGPSAHFAAPSPTDYISAISGLLTALRSTAEFSASTFTLARPALIADLVSDFAPEYKLRTSTVPALGDTPRIEISAELQQVYSAREKVDADKRKSQLFADLDKQFADFRNSLQVAGDTGTTPLASIIAGRSLMDALTNLSCSNFYTLTVDIDAAGGSSRTNHNFWVELFYTTPAPSYNGGAIVSFTVADAAGNLVTGETLSQMYGYSKWKPPKATLPNVETSSKRKASAVPPTPTPEPAK